tara:strand:- start:395 stop:601 length:207 start_codon:yes stop_codon:yes gene_type:complete
MGVQKNIKQLQEQVEVLGGALTRALKDLDAVKMLAQGTLTSFQLHIGQDEWDKLVEELKDLEKRDVEQ